MYNKVKLFREKLNKSQKEVAKEIGVTRQTISLIEVGKYNPTLKLCVLLAKSLHTDLNTLFWSDDYEN
ncbi:helix-turn-helix transcriptional regulator [Lactobacillus sp. LL6]|uniref:helix-turn-helix transcriptional regulator n=1 Tax=Lactobacillus sp. LL6 TaxID=2596827 RepID=UPI0011862573|nr:helix-turn-helix transcriptional regulator [Lactobacillus sp. LL6]TSO25563.1 helix-turn-helix transcriptional regulator [Lactobacillus sp. LL6]